MQSFREMRSFGPRRPISPAKGKRRKWVTFVTRSLLSFFRSTQTHGYKFLVQPNRPKCEIVFWTVTLAFLSAFTLWLVLYVYIPILSQPTVTKQSPFYRSVSRVPFPTIAFCSTNRISRVALMNYSEFMWAHYCEWVPHLSRLTSFPQFYRTEKVLGQFGQYNWRSLRKSTAIGTGLSNIFGYGWNGSLCANPLSTI